MSSPSGDTVILGAGIIGLSTAYYLSQSGKTKPESIHLVDSSPQLFYCASGLAGGFLAADWFAPSNASLGALSFALHKLLAEKYDGRNTWGFSLSTSLSLSHDSEAAVGGSGEDWLEQGTSRAQATGAKGPGKDGFGPRWLKRGDEGSLEAISREGTVGQIDPLRFCQWLLARCLERGVKLHQPARAISVSRDENNQLNGVRISNDGAETELPCTRLLIAAGAWTPRVFSTLFPKSKARIPVASLAGHSLLIRNPFHNPAEADKEPCHAVFATDSLGFSPEWFSRVGGELYLAGLNTTMMPLPELATDVMVVDEAMQKMKQCAAEMIGTVDGKPMEVLREALCFRPVSSSGRPLVCRVPDEKLAGGIKTRGGGEGGVFLAAGHGAWGISQAPGTGLVMAELIEGRQPSANLSALVLPS
ncbi:FAD dependent oxidoreductase-like protein superfamily [Lentithecium fluviatile CBS 122367]|uniref:FAD dependent oxidoreductase-like protein superfamily n=1 Tax=Lentithecium fluviatile CBS 122367 TaxID=1168545 RepID=A0A6G1JA76_9PLEO|nr:FAD dependent oxidoreductase-like protein superfamily [Lentithecium fluviatile CBS 122367]